MTRLFFLIGCFYGFFSVALGAFGAHGLESHLTPKQMQIYETAVRYQFFHALAILAAALAVPHANGFWLGLGASAFTAGTAVFSGSLYILVLTGVRAWGAVTPVGGLLLLAGWVFFATAVVKGAAS